MAKINREYSEKSKRSNCKHYYGFKLTEEQNIQFEELYEKSGCKSYSKFIVGRLFDAKFTVYSSNIDEQKYYIKLSGFYRQFAAIGNNYNQVTKAIRTNFGEKRAAQMLESLRKDTARLADMGMKIVELTEEYKKTWLDK